MTDTRSIQIRVSADLHRQVKAQAAMADTTLKTWVIEAIAEKANRDKGKR